MLLKTLLLFSCVVTAGDFTTYIGGPSFPDGLQVLAMATDAAGNTYLTGKTTEPILINGPTPPTDVFVTKLDPTGQTVFTRTFGGSGAWAGNTIAVDPAGEIYVAGVAGSTDLLLTNALETAGSSFIVRLSGDGETVQYATYFGGSSTGIYAITTDAAGNLYLTGGTSDPKFPVTAGMPSDPNADSQKTDAYVMEISAAGDKILYSGVIGGSKAPCPQSGACPPGPPPSFGNAIAVDAKGNAYIGGNSGATDLPVTKGVLNPGGFGPFVAKVNAGGAGLGYLTYLGSAYTFLESSLTISGADIAAASNLIAIAVDAAGNAYLTGYTSDPNFPTTPGAYQTFFAGAAGGPNNSLWANAFAAKLAPDGSRMIWATYIGGTGPDIAESMAVDSRGSMWISGSAASPGFPNANGWSNGRDFLVEVAAGGASLGYTARYPAETADMIGLDSSGLVHAAGSPGIVSGILPGSAPTMRPFGVVNIAGGETTARVTAGEVITIYGPHIGPANTVTGTPDSSGSFSTTLGGVQVSFGGQNAPLLSVSDSEITAVVPTGAVGLGEPSQVNTHNLSPMVITNGQTTSPPFPVDSVGPLPEMFLNSSGYAAAVNQDGTVNSSAIPAKAGSIISIWVNGMGINLVPAGQIATVPLNLCPSVDVCTIAVNVYGNQEFTGEKTTPAMIQYAGPAPGLVTGITQINFVAPAPPTGNSEVSFYLTIASYATSQSIVFTSQ